MNQGRSSFLFQEQQQQDGWEKSMGRKLLTTAHSLSSADALSDVPYILIIKTNVILGLKPWLQSGVPVYHSNVLDLGGLPAAINTARKRLISLEMVATTWKHCCGGCLRGQVATRPQIVTSNHCTQVVAINLKAQTLKQGYGGQQTRRMIWWNLPENQEVKQSQSRN